LGFVGRTDSVWVDRQQKWAGMAAFPTQALRNLAKSEMDRKRGLLAATGSLARLKKKSSTATMFYQSKLVTSTSSYFLRQKNIGFIPGKLVQI